MDRDSNSRSTTKKITQTSVRMGIHHQREPALLPQPQCTEDVLIPYFAHLGGDSIALRALFGIGHVQVEPQSTTGLHQAGSRSQLQPHCGI